MGIEFDEGDMWFDDDFISKWERNNFRDPEIDDYFDYLCEESEKNHEENEDKYYERIDNPKCPLCGVRMSERFGPFGKFWGCSRFPKCRGTKKCEENEDSKSYKDQNKEEENSQNVRPRCPKCGTKMFLKVPHYFVGKIYMFWGCQRFPNCRGMRSIRSS